MFTNAITDVSSMIAVTVAIPLSKPAFNVVVAIPLDILELVVLPSVVVMFTSSV